MALSILVWILPHTWHLEATTWATGEVTSSVVREGLEWRLVGSHEECPSCPATGATQEDPTGSMKCMVDRCGGHHAPVYIAARAANYSQLGGKQGLRPTLVRWGANTMKW